MFQANEAPLTHAQKPAGNFFGIGGSTGDLLRNATNSFLTLALLKQFQDANDGEFGYEYDPNTGLRISNTKTTGSVGPRSFWGATDMFWVAGAAGIVLLIYLAKK